MTEVVLRGKQPECVQGLHEGFVAGHKWQMLYGPTGMGKTETAVAMIKKALERGKRVAFVVDMNSLVYQTSERFHRYGIDHGVLQGDQTHGEWKMMLVVSVQTAESRGFPIDIDCAFIDEGHLIRKSVVEWRDANPDMYGVGLSATPFTPGLGEIYTNLVSKVTTNQLIADGLLSPVRFFAAKATSDVERTGREVSQKEAKEGALRIVGDVVSEWDAKCKEIFGHWVKTIAFAASVEDGERLCKECAAIGANFQQISYRDTNSDRRRELIEEFSKPDSVIDGLVSCEALAKGFDVPDILCGIDVRPYRKSFHQFIQKVGRVMRIADGKSFAIWIDHAENCARFWDEMQDLFENGVTALDGGKFDERMRKDLTTEEKADRTCSACTAMIPKGVKACPSCGHEIEGRSLVEHEAGEVVEIDGKQVALQPYLSDRTAVWRQLCGIAVSKGKGGDIAHRWCQAQYRKLYGERADGWFDRTTPLQPTPKLVSKVKSMEIAFRAMRSRQLS